MVELKAEDPGFPVVGESLADGEECIWGEKGVGVEEKEYLSRCNGSAGVHLVGPAALRDYDARTIPDDIDGRIDRPSVGDDNLEGGFLPGDGVDREGDAVRFIQGRYDDGYPHGGELPVHLFHAEYRGSRFQELAGVQLDRLETG